MKVSRTSADRTAYDFYANGKGFKTFDEALIFLMRAKGGELIMPNGEKRLVKVNGDEVELI